MKAIIKARILIAVTMSGLFSLVLAGCAHIRPFGEDFHTSRFAVASHAISPEYFSQLAPSLGALINSDEMWIVPRDSSASLLPGNAPDVGSLLAKFGEAEIPLPLKHTDMKASVMGCIGTVEVTQQFENTYAKKIEAVYVFSLPHNAAVNDFVLTIGKRHIRGIIRERKEAEAIYQEAKSQGFMVTLLAEREPNIFMQSIANLEASAEVDVHIQYIQRVDYVNGWYEFIFPMMGMNSDPASPLERDGSDISMRVDVNAGVPVEEVECETHAIEKSVLSTNHFVVQLVPSQRIPNKDFVLRYRVARDEMRSSLITHHDKRGGYFTLLLYPPKEVGNPAQPALTHIRLDGGAVQISDVFPRQVPDLIYGRAEMIAGRFDGSRMQRIRVMADSASGPVEFEVSATDDEAGARSGLPNIWARMKIMNLLKQSGGGMNQQFSRQINQVALDYNLVSPFTDFITVDASRVTEGETAP